ncbi:MAG: hypothetical protein DRQ40_00530 [Gammaproteobacteria bacterium]|nr:MAG: hypothetical protein DRQ40_00530 [Gammaproteobacteria bacterium]
MTFDFSIDGILIPVYDGSDFQEDNLTITGTGDISVVQVGGVFTVSSTTSSGTIDATYLRLDGANGPMTGFYDLAGDPTTGLQATTKDYVDAAVSGATLSVEDDGVEQSDSAATLNFSTGLTAASGAGDLVTLTVDESELTTFVHLTGSVDEAITGNKTFDDDVIVAGDFTVSGTTTYLNTEELLVEDNIITLNHTFSGVPSLDAGIEVERGNEDRAQLLWDESLDRWIAGVSGTFVADDDVLVLRSEIADFSTDADLIAASGVLQTDIDSRVLRAGDTMSGDLNLATGIDIQPVVSGTSDIGAVSTPLAELHVDQGFNYNAPSLDDHIANKAYVDAQVSSAAIEVQESDVTVTGSASILNFGDGFSVANDGGGKVSITLDAAEGQFMDLINDQTASGIKTFADGIILGSLSEPTTATGTGTVGDIRWADDYIYVAVATDTWKRVAIASF